MIKLLVTFFLVARFSSAVGAELMFTNESRIVVDADPSPDMVQGAKDLERLIAKATGLQFEVSTKPGTAPCIRLVEDSSLPQDGYDIRITGSEVVISGSATKKPSAMWDLPSHGLLHGTSEFLERFVGVRWLFPGGLGEDVPRVDALRVKLDAPLRGAPSVAARALAYLGEDGKGANPHRLETLDWMRHLRLLNGMHPYATGYGHSWDDFLKPADMEAHPEWRSTNGEPVRNGKVKFFCTTAPGLVELFAQRVIESLDKNPAREMTSISPTDGGGFCSCDRCKPHITKDAYGKPNHAQGILTFYKRVAEIIARERPGRRLGGFVYYNYQYPLADLDQIKLPDNLSLCWAPLNYYGYGLLKPVYRDEFASVMERWSRATPHLFYHNYSTWMRSYHGAPLPVSLEIMKLELPTAVKHGAWGARMVGTNAWGVNAPINYLLAKQMWDSKIDLSATLNDWLARAYGPGWQAMRELYDELDVAMKKHKEAQSPTYKGSQYEVNEDVMQNVYAPILPTMERRYSTALKQCTTDVQRARLQMFGDNLIQLHYALRKAKLIADDTQSLFYRDDTAFQSFLKSMESSISLYQDAKGIDHGPIWKGEYGG